MVPGSHSYQAPNQGRGKLPKTPLQADLNFPFQGTAWPKPPSLTTEDHPDQPRTRRIRHQVAPAGRAVLLRGLPRWQKGLSVQSAPGRAPKLRSVFKIFSGKWFCRSERGHGISPLQTVLPPIPARPGQPQCERLGETADAEEAPPGLASQAGGAWGGPCPAGRSACGSPALLFSPQMRSPETGFGAPVGPACWTLSPTPLFLIISLLPKLQ